MKPDPKDIHSALLEFVADVEACGPSTVKEDWPDLYITYVKACKALGKKPKKVKRDDQGGISSDWLPARTRTLNNETVRVYTDA